jgi:uncharacterized protein YwlG (UPF0340 family)
VAVETLDQILSEALGIHFLEPMAQVKEHLRARPVLKAMMKDKVMAEVAVAPSKHLLGGANTKQAYKSTRKDKVSHSTDATPLRPSRTTLAG